uniref:Tudor domain-containing protein n=2 Tax=Caenorhabditis tropicalis TaxID=1561998 RepID=A0A1I7TQI3_9PELO
MTDVLVTLFPSNIAADPTIEEIDSEQDNEDIILLEEFRRELPTDWCEEAQEELKDIDKDWDIDTCKLTEWNDSLLQEYLLEDGCFWAFISARAVVCPWNIHCFPIILPKERLNNEDWIMKQIQENRAKQQDFDDFYSRKQNQRPLDNEEIRFAFTCGRVYAIACLQHRKKTGAQWVRVEIRDCLRNNNVAVRFVDQGHVGFIKVKHIYRMHHIHAKIPPFALEIGKIFDDETVSEQEMEWSAYHLRQIVPFDYPVVIGPRLDFVETGKLLFSEIRRIGEERNLLDEIPPAPILTDRSDDELSWDEDQEEKFNQVVEFDGYSGEEVSDEEEEDDYEDSDLSGGSQIY